MPFDPTKPVTNSLITSAEMRDQFNGLKELIDDIPPAEPETDPVFMASEAHLFMPGDKAKLDSLNPAPKTGDYTMLYPASGDVRQPSVDHDTLVLPSVQLLAGIPGQQAIVTAQSDGTNPPANEVARVELSKAELMVPLMFVCKKGQYYRISTSVSGGATAVLNYVLEYPINL